MTIHEAVIIKITKDFINEPKRYIFLGVILKVVGCHPNRDAVAEKEFLSETDAITWINEQIKNLEFNQNT